MGWLTWALAKSNSIIPFRDESIFIMSDFYSFKQPSLHYLDIFPKTNLIIDAYVQSFTVNDFYKTKKNQFVEVSTSTYSIKNFYLLNLTTLECISLRSLIPNPGDLMLLYIKIVVCINKDNFVEVTNNDKLHNAIKFTSMPLKPIRRPDVSFWVWVIGKSAFLILKVPLSKWAP